MTPTGEQQARFFDTFGYLLLPGLLRDELGWIEEEFEAVFQERTADQDGSRRALIMPFIDLRERFCRLLDGSPLDRVFCTLLGADYNYLGSDGNLYVGDTPWHADGKETSLLILKAAIYLDPVTRETGCLRVIPGTHRARDSYRASLEEGFRRKAKEHWGVPGSETPAVALESRPGDVVVFNRTLLHASFGGNARRRMFCLKCSPRARTPQQEAELKELIDGHARFEMDSLFAEPMKRTAGPERIRHLEQALALETDLPALAAQARREGTRPAMLR